MGEITFDVYMLSYQTKKIIYIVPRSLGIAPYFIEKICSQHVTITKMKSIYIWELKKFVDKQDVVYVEMYKLLTHFFHEGFFVPPFVRQVLDIDKPVPIGEIIKIDKNNLKRVRKFDSEISNDPDALKFFYEQMYLPHTKTRYGDLGIENFDNFEKIFKNGELVFVTLNGRRISADLNEMIGDTYFLRKGGLIDEDFVKKVL